MEQLRNSENTSSGWNRIDVIVIGGGQAGLSVSYHLAQLGVHHVVLDAAAHIGDAWRNRWDSLRLFTPARYDGLDGMRFPADGGNLPTKDEMADYLQAYASHFGLPVLSGMRVDSLFRDGDDFIVTCGARVFITSQVVVAMANLQVAQVPAGAKGLSPAIRQFDAVSYRNPEQLAEGTTLIVGAGNSGAEIAKDLSATHPVVLAGAGPGELPFASTSFIGRHIVVHLLNRIIFPKVLSVDTPIGRRVRPNMMKRGVPLIRVRSKELVALGVRRVGRCVGSADGRPLLEDGTVLPVANVVWCAGFIADFSWIHLPVFGANGEPIHDRGLVATEPGLYFVGLHFLTSVSSAMVHGVGRDARRIASVVAERVEGRPPATEKAQDHAVGLT